MIDNIEIKNQQTDISTPKYNFRKKRRYDETFNDLSTQLNQMSFIHKKEKRQVNNDDFLEKKETTQQGLTIIKINMDLEKQLVSEYYKKQNVRLNKLMFGSSVS